MSNETGVDTAKNGAPDPPAQTPGGFPLVGFVASVWLAVFIAIWFWIAWKLWHFTPTSKTKTLHVTSTAKTLAGATASSIAAATASALGIKVQKLKRGGDTRSVAQRARTSIGGSGVLTAAVIVYVIVGVVVGLVLVVNDAQAPDMVQTFIVGVAGWMAGAVAAVGGTRDP